MVDNNFNLNEIRKQFPVTNKCVYFNHAGVSPIPIETKTAMKEFLDDTCNFGNINSKQWEKRINSIRKKVGVLLGSDEDEIAFIKNTSHGLSLIANGINWRWGDNVIITDIEFPANVYPWLSLVRFGVQTRFVKNREGRILIEDIESSIDSKTRLLSISSVEFSNGFRNDIARIGEICKKNGVFFSLDAIQSLGALKMDVELYGVDFLSADGHKWLLSPEGTGIFFCSKRVMDVISPSLIGWNSVIDADNYLNYDLTLKGNARKFEEGSHNVLGICGLGASIEMLVNVGIDFIEKRILLLTDMIIEGLIKRGYTVLSSLKRNERSGIVSFKGNEDSMLIYKKMRDKGIYTSLRDGAVRVSPHFYNSEDEVEQFFSALTS